MLFLKNNQAFCRPEEVYFYIFGGTFAYSQNDRLAEVGRNFWTIPFKSSTHAGSHIGDFPGACADSF